VSDSKKDLEHATWDCTVCDYLRCVVVFSQLPKTPRQRGRWLGRIYFHEEQTGHLVYPKHMLPWKGETIVVLEEDYAPVV
jgi:hypothetical protein